MSWRTGGVRPWIIQRLSAVFMVVVLVYFTLALVAGGANNFNEWQQWMASPIWNVIVIMFWIALITHAWIGVRDVCMDYLYMDALRVFVLACFAFYLIAMLIWMLRIMLLVGA